LQTTVPSPASVHRFVLSHCRPSRYTKASLR